MARWLRWPCRCGKEMTDRAFTIAAAAAVSIACGVPTLSFAQEMSASSQNLGASLSESEDSSSEATGELHTLPHSREPLPNEAVDEIAPGLVPRYDFTELIRRAFEQDPPKEPVNLASVYRGPRSTEVVEKPGGKFEIVLENGSSFEPSWSRSPLSAKARAAFAKSISPSYFDVVAKYLESVVPSAMALPTATACPSTPLIPAQESCYPASTSHEAVTISGFVTKWIDNSGVEHTFNPPADLTKGYDYVPSVMKDGNKYKIWWCAHNENWGDRINYTEVTSLTSPGTYTISEVFRGQGAPLPPNTTAGSCGFGSQFDCAQTCDPTVIKFPGLNAGQIVNVYFMAYSGFQVGRDLTGTLRTKVGLALSLDGKRWSRVDGDPSTPTVIDPILVPSENIQVTLDDDANYDEDPNTNGNTISYPLYGVGHPSITFNGSKFYITVTDDSNPETLQRLTNAVNGTVPDPSEPSTFLPPLEATSQIGAGDDYDLNSYPAQKQFALRSVDIAFQIGTEEWRDQSNNWVSISSGFAATREDSYLPYVTLGGNTFQVEYTSVDWAFSPQTRKFLMAVNGLVAGTGQEYNSFRFFDEELNEILDEAAHVESTWEEGPGLVRRPNGQAMLSLKCDNYRLQTLRPIYVGPPGITDPTERFFKTELAYFEEVVETGLLAPPTSGGSRCKAVPDDYDGDGISDETVYRPSTGTLWVNYTSSAPVGHVIGGSTSLPVEGDFDGDGTIDIAFVTPQTGGAWTWTISCSSGVCPCSGSGCSSGSYTVANWGQTGDQIVVEDYNGDGRDDVAYYRPAASNMDWWIKYADGTEKKYNYGNTSTDIAAPGDYNGDGYADAAIYRNTDNTYYILYGQVGGTYSIALGDKYCTPVPGDWDGDGMSDFVYYRHPNEKFYFRSSAGGGTFSMQWGLPDDVPLTGDYNGDGWLDAVVWRELTGPEEGVWHIAHRKWNQLLSTQAVQWGLQGDKISEFYP